MKPEGNYIETWNPARRGARNSFDVETWTIYQSKDGNMYYAYNKEHDITLSDHYITHLQNKVDKFML